MNARFMPLLLGLGLIFGGGFSACAYSPRHYGSKDPDAGAAAGRAPDAAGGSAGRGGGAGGGGGSGTTCTLGQARCEDLSPERCSETGEWVPTQASCAIACLDGECVGCVEDVATCKDGAIQKCVAGAWVTDRVCEKACEVDACVDSCTESRYQCNGTRWLQKCVAGEFVDDTECDVLCSANACTGVCMPDTRRCNPDAPNDSQVCNAQGNWDQSSPCATDTFCVSGNCKSCSPDTSRCSEAGPQLCSEVGEWVNQGACVSPNAACFQGKCVACTPGDKRCADHAVEQCTPDGSAWDVFETCSGDTPACLSTTKTCGKCTEGEAQCFDDKVQTCDDQGVFQDSETCSGGAPQCVGAECTACDPDAGERRCASPTSTQACNPDGTWAPATACTGDAPSCREDLSFSCGCDEGTRRCRNSTVPELCQGGAWVAQSACAGTLDYCLPASGQCVDCVPGVAECKSGIAHQCNTTGAFESLNSCSGPGINCGNCNVGEPCTLTSECKTGFCVGSKCAVCQPTTRECVGSTPRLCSNDGAWTNQTNCAGSTPECLASTGQCVACLNGASRSCGNCNTGTQSCSNNLWGACTGAVDLSTSEQYCGNCSTSCSSSQLCESGSCVCSSGTHGCGSSSTCYSNTDADHCGPSCHDCSTYVGTTGACGSNQCTCEGTSLPCGATTPTCGSWDFNSNTVEGWKFGNSQSTSNHRWVGTLGTATTNGSPALRAQFDGVAQGGGVAEFEVDLCSNGAILNLSSYALSYDYYFLTSGGSRFSPDPSDGTDSILINNNTVLTGCQPFADPGSDEWLTGQCSNFPSSVTNLTIVFRLGTGWAGTVFLDNVKFTPK